jgi:hypothetical protein
MGIIDITRRGIEKLDDKKTLWRRVGLLPGPFSQLG